MIISGISNPSPQNAALADSQRNTQANIQNNTQAGIQIDPVGPATSQVSEVITSPAASSAKDVPEKDEAAQSTSVKSFAYGALGMDHPDKVEQKQDDSYTAGQYLKAAATLGSVIALFI